MDGGHQHQAGTSRDPGFSLLRLSAAQRCGGALIIIACLWAAVWWALH
jgi:hypothetical protein